MKDLAVYSSFLLAFCLVSAAEPVSFTRGDSREELAARVANMQVRMRAESMDAVFLTAEANIRYFTGFSSSFFLSPTRPWYIIVPASGLPTAVVPTIGEDAFARAYTGRVITWPSPRVHDEGISELLSVFSELPRVSGRIGAELGSETTVRMRIIDFDRFRSKLNEQGMQMVDASDAILRARLVKSETEMARMHAACRAMSAGYRKIPETITEGMTEVEACNAIKRLFLSMGADDTLYVICRAGPISYSDIIGHPTQRRLQLGDVMVLDTGCQVDGYFCDFNRNFAIGPPAKEVNDTYAKLYAATDAALQIIKPGMKFQDIYRVMAESMEVSPSGGVGRMGHSVGLQLTEWPSIHPDVTESLAAGMVLSVEPSLGIPSGEGRYVVTEEVVVVTETGYRLLSERAPHHIAVVHAVASASRSEL